MYISMYVYIYMYTYIYMHAYICIHNTCTHMHMYVNIYIYIYLYIQSSSPSSHVEVHRKRKHTHTNTHTHTHTHAPTHTHNEKKSSATLANPRTKSQFSLIKNKFKYPRDPWTITINSCPLTLENPRIKSQLPNEFWHWTREHSPRQPTKREIANPNTTLATSQTEFQFLFKIEILQLTATHCNILQHTATHTIPRPSQTLTLNLSFDNWKNIQLQCCVVTKAKRTCVFQIFI